MMSPRKQIGSLNTPISVIMVARNSERTISLAIKSALLGLSKNSELLLLLDACTDATGVRARQVKDNRLKIFETDKNIGVAAGRNFLVERSSYEVIAICDSDDLFFPWRFSAALRALDSAKLDFHFQNAIIFGFAGSLPILLPQIPEGLTPARANRELGKSNPFVHSSATFQKSSFEKVGGYRALASEDYDLWLRASQHSMKIARSGFWGVGYRVHKSQLTRDSSWQDAVRTDSELYALVREQRHQFGQDQPSDSQNFFGTFRRFASKLASRLGLATSAPEGKKGESG